MRWNHPTRGVILPGEFIPIAEEDGLIEPIGMWVLERACTQVAQWQRDRPDAAPIGLSVNLSAKQVANRKFPGAISEILRATGLDPRLIEPRDNRERGAEGRCGADRGFACAQGDRAAPRSR